MALQALIVTLFIGGIAGWLAGLIMKGRGFGVLGNIVVGVVGAFVGHWTLGRVGVAIGGGMFAEIINAVIGAVIVLFLIGLVKKA